MDEPVTPDNTRVFRIMNDFQEFMNQHAASSSSNRTISYHEQSIPFNLPDDTEQQPYRKRSHSATNRVRIAQIEGERASEERAHKMARLDLESRNEKLISENLQLKQKCDQLQLKVKQVTVQAIEARDQLHEIRSTRTNQKQQLEETLLDLQKKQQAGEVELQHNVNQLQQANQGLRQQKTDLAIQLNVVREKLAEVTALLDQKMERVEKLTKDLQDHQNCEISLRDYQMKVKDLEMRLSRSSEAEEMASLMKDDLQRLRELELEVVKLRDSNASYRESESNVALMKEKLMAAEMKLVRSEERLERVAMIEMENKDLICQLNEAKTKEIKTSDNSELVARISELQGKEAVFAFERSELQGQLASYKNKCDLLQTSLTNSEQRLGEKTDSISAKETQIRHLQKRALLLAGERNSLRTILQSYDSELTTTSHADQLITRTQNAEAANEKVHARMEELHKEMKDTTDSLMRYKLTARQLEAKVLQLTKKLEQGGGGAEKNIKIETLYKKVEELERERSELQKTNEHLTLWVEHNKMRGDFDPSKTRVLHLKMNPADLAHRQSKLEVIELREKCSKLREKVKKLEENADMTANITLLSAQDDDLKQKLENSELRNQRLKEVFKKKIQEFREACYILTGFKINVTTDNQFKLVSMYSENEEDYLLFKLNSAGEMQLLETEYSKTLKELIELHLHHQNSIPMFLSSITADLFSQQTMVL